MSLNSIVCIEVHILWNTKSNFNFSVSFIFIVYYNQVDYSTMAGASSDNPSFVCASGELLWGQLHCIVEGYLANNLDAQSTLSPTFTSGTIIKRNLKYRVKAAKGLWNVREMHSRIDRDHPSYLSGFVVYNSNLADPVDIVKKCAKVGMHSKPNVDNTVVYVNRYDWSWAHELPDEPEELLYAGLNDDLEQKVRKMMGQRIILADAGAGLAVINQLKQNLSELPKNELIKKSLIVDQDPIGVHLACPNTEYELGWMVFNSSNQEELIAFVYDGAYTGLEGEISLNDGRMIRTMDEWLAVLNA